MNYLLNALIFLFLYDAGLVDVNKCVNVYKH